MSKVGGRQAVDDFWLYLSDNFLTNLRDLVAEHGIRGCWLYWSRTLNEGRAFLEPVPADKLKNR